MTGLDLVEREILVRGVGVLIYLILSKIKHNVAMHSHAITRLLSIILL